MVMRICSPPGGRNHHRLGQCPGDIAMPGTANLSQLHLDSLAAAKSSSAFSTLASSTQHQHCDGDMSASSTTSVPIAFIGAQLLGELFQRAPIAHGPAM